MRFGRSVTPTYHGIILIMVTVHPWYIYYMSFHLCYINKSNNYKYEISSETLNSHPVYDDERNYILILAPEHE